MTRLSLAVFQRYPACIAPFLIIFQLLCTEASVAAEALEARRIPDVRLLIDVSEDSVSQEEGLILSEWLEGFLFMLPPDARTGVWRFGGIVDEVLPLDTLSARFNWAAGSILNSQALSDLPAALVEASIDSAAAGTPYETTIVIVTDSGVNVSASPITNAHAARRILTELVPALHKADVTVHTIALGEEADGYLLRALAHGTHGLDFQAKSVADLPDVILQLLDVTAPASAVVANERGFTVAESDRALQVLLTHVPEETATLVEPSQTVLSKSSSPPGAQWHSGNTFAAITLHNPISGNWQWRGAQPNSSVIRVSEGIGIQVGKLPLVVSAGSEHQWQLYVPALGSVSAQRGPVVTVEVTNPLGDQQVVPVKARDTELAGTRYTVNLPIFDLPGRYRVMARLQNLDIIRQSVTWVEVLPTGLNQSITTRSRVVAEQNFQRPALSLAALGLATMVILGWVLRQRRQRKLDLWHRRFHDPQ